MSAGANHKCRHWACEGDPAHASANDLKVHIETDHPGGLVCEDCGYEYQSQAGLRRHRLKHTNNDKYKCFVYGCNATYSRQDQLGAHLVRQHEGILRDAMKEYQRNLLRRPSRKGKAKASTSQDVDDEDN